MRAWRGLGLAVSAVVLLAACAAGPRPPRDRLVVRPGPVTEPVRDRQWRLWRLADRGDFLRCRLEDGRIRMGGDWRRYQPEVFFVLRGQTRRLRVLRADGKAGRWLWVRYRGDGRRLKLCTVPVEDAPRSRCIRLAVDHRRDFRHGVSGVRSARRAFRTVTLSCRWPRRKPPFDLVFGPDPH